ncbi:MAG: FAD-dependent hydroxylase [Cyanobacteria bacterium P01_D01_bin.1]
MPLLSTDQTLLPSETISAADYSAVGYEVRTYDVVIVGGGVVGLVLACGLRNTGLRVAVIEAQSAQQAAGRQRAYAFSPVSAKILEGLGLWETVGPQLIPFQRVKLSDADYRKSITFRPEHGASRGKREAVYYSAEHTVLMSALQAAVEAAVDIDYWCETRVLVEQSEGASDTKLSTGSGAGAGSGADSGADLVVERAERRYQLRTQLVVGADGAKSGVRDRAQIKTFGWKYWQSCITAVLEPEQSHCNTAYEKFWPSGPFAILPLPHNRCQIVWTAPHAEAKAMLALPKEQFLQELKARYGNQMGELRLVNQPMIFPVQLMQSKQYVRPGTALIGDAAHSCHPVGGQGLNMGIRDATVLAEIIQQAALAGENLGSLKVLKRYERWRRTENWFTLSLTDFLNRAFSNRFVPLVIARRAGIWVLDTITPLKRLILRLMTGFFGRLPAKAK